MTIIWIEAIDSVERLEWSIWSAFQLQWLDFKVNWWLISERTKLVNLFNKMWLNRFRHVLLANLKFVTRRIVRLADFLFFFEIVILYLKLISIYLNWRISTRNVICTCRCNRHGILFFQMNQFLCSFCRTWQFLCTVNPSIFFFMILLSIYDIKAPGNSHITLVCYPNVRRL